MFRSIYISTVPPSAWYHASCIIPQMDIRDNYAVLAARVIATHLTCSSTLRTCVPEHIQYEYSAVMKEKKE